MSNDGQHLLPIDDGVSAGTGYRWSGKKTAVAAALAIGLSTVAAVGAAAAVPQANASTREGGTPGGAGGFGGTGGPGQPGRGSFRPSGTGSQAIPGAGQGGIPGGGLPGH